MKNKNTSNFYNAILQNLFFGTLNQKMDERRFAQEGNFQANRNEYGVKNLYRYSDKFLISKEDALKLFKNIPFLNGGLFDCLDKEDETGKVIYIDGFSRDPKKQAIIPDYLFFMQNEERVDLSQYGLGSSRPVRGLTEILNSYNFTIDENTPVDQEIALDPELLGKVFENLLASYNPETATTARKATGSYYTPREIVSYMVDESLIAYLSQQICQVERTDNDSDSRLRDLLSYSDEAHQFNSDEVEVLINAIDNMKILDPACGSGAFPMGILQKLVHILQKLDPDNEHWYELQYQKALKESEDVFKQRNKEEREERLREINDAFDEGINYPDYARKLYLIENCIYGVDIQPIATQISKLRFFISLVLDQKVDPSKENLGIMALPNLETKFVAANTLIGLDKPDHLFYTEKIKALEEEIKSLRHRYFQAKTRKEKLNYQKKDKEIRNLLAKELEAIGFSSTSSEKIASFDIYDQNASADWFDPEWMFGLFPYNRGAGGCSSDRGVSHRDGVFKEGGVFDIVIGNPPYIRQEELKPKKPILQKQGYEVFNSTSDIYTYFYEKGWQLLNNHGYLTFITSNKWMRAKYGEKLRKFFKEKTTIKQIIDFGGHKVFESSTVDTNIVIFQKNGGANGQQNTSTLKVLSVKPDFISTTDLTKYFEQNAITMRQPELDEKCFTFGDDAVMNLKKKIEQAGLPLKDWDVKIYRGVLTGFNEAFIIDNDTKERLCQEDPKSAEILKPILRGRDIQRYSYKWAGLWIIKIESGWTNKNRGNKEPGNFFKESYPAIYKHLKSMGESKGKGKGIFLRDDQGDYWWELRDCDYYPEFEKEKIVYPNMTKFLPFVYDNMGYYTNQKCYIITGKTNLKFLIGILNSSLYSWYIRFLFPELKGGTRELNENVFRNISIPKIPESAQQPFITLVDQILAAKEKDPNADTSDLERQIDELVYRLYDLTEEEIAIVEKGN